MLIALYCVSGAAAADRQTITLNSGKTFNSARIVAIGEKTATIAHEGGTAAVPKDDVPLDILARAHMRLEAGGKKQQDEEARRGVETREKKKTEDRDDELKARLAMAAAREKAERAEAQTQKTKPNRPSRQSVEKRLAELKASIPTAPSSQDPRVRDIVSKYQRAFASITAETIPQATRWIRDNLQRDLAGFEQDLATTRVPAFPNQKTATSAIRASAEVSKVWLQRLSGHLAQVEGLAK